VLGAASLRLSGQPMAATAPSPANERCPMADKQVTLQALADLVDKLEELHSKLFKLELTVEAQLRRN